MMSFIQIKCNDKINANFIDCYAINCEFTFIDVRFLEYSDSVYSFTSLLQRFYIQVKSTFLVMENFNVQNASTIIRIRQFN